MDIDENIKEFQKGQGPKDRYASFDYCFNYFQSFKEKGTTSELAAPENLQNSCLQLGYFLASWGMLKGKCFLLQKSVKFYEPLIKHIASIDKEIWEIDAHIYTERNIALLIKCKDGIRKALGVKNNPSDTLLTKIMLGIFANTPAFDTYFKKGLSVGVYNELALNKVAKFYDDYKEKIDQWPPIYTFDFATGKETRRKYTKAKLIDMIGFIEGIHKEKLNRIKTCKDRATL